MVFHAFHTLSFPLSDFARGRRTRATSPAFPGQPAFISEVSSAMRTVPASRMPSVDVVFPIFCFVGSHCGDAHLSKIRSG